MLQLPILFADKPALKRLVSGVEQEETFSRNQVRSLLAAAFLCLYKLQQPSSYTSLAFDVLFANSIAPQEKAKLSSLMQYFNVQRFQ